ncbi:SpoIID/LytB domain-containing protein [Chakrabartyella piscis]|uniref:SpoIID/LytB domain-containing protein n=1 Tax=Chakrabartyella piscis TaxID=2918914 RepID=UPI0029585E15|nr:SpoIID/LytB domain-containing protein [Chakrabartyella piscis]
MKWICICLMCCMLTACGSMQKESSLGLENGTATELPDLGRIGEETTITRGEVAKMVALAFYTQEELMELEDVSDFSDVSHTDTSYPYINAVVEKGFFSGDEEGFRGDENLILSEAQVLLNRIAPDYESQMVLTDENKNMPVSYGLWMELYERALCSRRGEDSLYSYGISLDHQVLFAVEGNQATFDGGIYTHTYTGLEQYINTEISFLVKNGTLIGLWEVVDVSPTIFSVYATIEGNELTIYSAVEQTYVYQGDDWEGICNVTIENGVVTVEKGYLLEQPIIKRVDNEEIYLADIGELYWAEGRRIYKEDGSFGTPWNLISGSDMADFYLDSDGDALGAVIKEMPLPEEIRVLLGGGLQEKLTIFGDFTLTNGDVTQNFMDEIVVLTPDSDWVKEGIVEITGDATLEFADGVQRTYDGALEVMEMDGALSVVNELPLESYLLGVVPHEMPSSFGQGALEAQAISARSYAYNQYYANAYGEYGAHVTDTVASQVYHGNDTTEEARDAVEATKGLTATIDGKVAQTYFYSTSGGFGANSNDVWSSDGSFSGTGKSYLQSQAYGVSVEEPESEADWLAFWQDWDMEGYDMDSPWYRWKVYFSCGQLTDILEQTLPEIYAATPNLVKYSKDGETWISGVPDDLGRLQGIQVVERGDGGVIRVLELNYEDVSVRVSTEYAIRKLLSPTNVSEDGDDIYLQRYIGESVVGQSILPSGHFAIKEMENESGELTGIAIYGGGNGHGVGMSQYGAKYLGEQGYSGAEIIEEYFTGVEVKQVM